ncbi:thioredoxin family protein [Mucilaginibacter rubeus]|uniref:Thioredoxin fold domain-containing protein n=1 Tax=Mucilaginibacter rubeus TaxID=2027860 RepID=A0A5C1I3F2_9SPHI|nr:thioredoxin fold domain-containing protein [Mucilaginibacter rubeus]QEM12732.1 thioredoxin fold domain-containing protein [Mucilaginibacter rubeus]
MNKVLIIALLLLSTTLQAAEKGIKFEKGLTWAQIKAKAKKENKYVFVDGFTSWCEPCKMMANEIFPQQKVGDFFNKNFINVSVQFDQTKNDNADVRLFYKDAKYLASTYKIAAYPTFLFFNPSGELVHTVVGGTAKADDFIAKAKSALDPATQYTHLKKQFEQGKRDAAFLLTLTHSAQQTGDINFIPVVANAYLRTQKDLLTEENIKLITVATKKSTDPGFAVLLRDADKVDMVAGKGQSAIVVNNIAFDELILPLLRKDGKKVDNGFMYYYTGDIITDVNWDAVKSKIEARYPGRGNDMIVCAKPAYYQWTGDKPQFIAAVNAYAARPSGFDINMLNSYAWSLYLDSDNQDYLKTAADWSKSTLTGGNEENLNYLNTYSCLLYKAGEKEAGIAAFEKLIKINGKENEALNKQLDQMKKGEKIW